MSQANQTKKAIIAASVYLELRGFTILERNYRRPNCEIDIIASRDSVVYFVEVRNQNDYEDTNSVSLALVTKHRQTVWGAHIWLEESKWLGKHVLAAVELSGPDCSVMGFIENT